MSPAIKTVRKASAEDAHQVLAVLAAARRYSTALDQRARRDRSDGAVLFIGLMVVALILCWAFTS